MRFVDTLSRWAHTTRMPSLPGLSGLNDTAKFFLYLRYSIHFTLLLLVIGVWARFVIALANGTLQITAGIIALLLLMIITVAVALYIVERTPALNYWPQNTARRGLSPENSALPLPPLFYPSLALTLISWLIGVIIALLPAFDTASSAVHHAAVNLVIISAGLIAAAYATNLRFPLLISVAIALPSSVAINFSVANGALMMVIFAVGLTLVTKVTMWSGKVVSDLERTRELESQLQVNEERLRVAQVLHDSIGQRLASLSLKTQLALTLQERGDERAGEHLRDLEDIIRAARDDLNQVVTGFRELSPADELNSATQLLHSASISVTVDGDIGSVPEHLDEVTAWFIRETTTNILKHSSATEVRFEFSPRAVTVTNDGATNSMGPLRGLYTLRQRTHRRGATIELSTNADRFSTMLTWKDSDEH